MAGKIQGLRATVQDEANRLKKLKVKIQEITEKQKQEKEEGKAPVMLPSEMSEEMRKAIIEQEKKRIQDENERLLQEERKKMEDKLAEEKRKLQMDAEKRFAAKAQSITVEEFVKLEMQV